MKYIEIYSTASQEDRRFRVYRAHNANHDGHVSQSLAAPPSRSPLLVTKLGGQARRKLAKRQRQRGA